MSSHTNSGTGTGCKEWHSDGLSATITPAYTGELIYHWKLSSGIITGAANGSSISVENEDLRDCEPPLSVHVQVNVEGLPESCDSSASADLELTTGNCDIFPVDDYEETVFTDTEKAHINNLVVQMFNNPGRKAYIILEASSDAAEKAVRLRVRKIKRFILTRKYPSDRFLFLLRRSDRDRTVMWLPPSSPPECDNCETL